MTPAQEQSGEKTGIGAADPFAALSLGPAVRSIAGGEKVPAMLSLPDGSRVALREYLASHDPMRLLWKNEADRAEALIFEFAQRGMPQQVIRWTGWAGKIGEYAAQLPALAQAFHGVKGFHVFGGTQVHNLDTGEVEPMTCDVPIALKRADKDLILIGVIPKVVEEPTYIPSIGLVLSVRPAQNQFTTINGDQNIGIVLQPDVNGVYSWFDEAKESHRQCSRLMDKGWTGALVVFGGSTAPDGAKKASNVEQEVRLWANDALQHPEKKINIILIRGSGGVADKLAADKEWLANNPCVKVVDLDNDSIRALVKGMGLATDW